MGGRRTPFACTPTLKKLTNPNLFLNNNLKLIVKDLLNEIKLINLKLKLILRLDLG